MTQSEARLLPLLSREVSPSHPMVPLIKKLLRAQGHWVGSDSKVFGPKMDAAVRYFQSTHLGPDGRFLTGDGEVGKHTWWALHNASGEPQRSHLVPVPEPAVRGEFARRYGMLSQDRQRFIALAFQQHAASTRELPDGSNKGDGVDKFIEGFGAVYWCALFISWLYRKITFAWWDGVRHAHVQTWWRAAKTAGRTFTLADRLPLPGDLCVWHFARGAGHISVFVASDRKCSKMNTIGGNEGNRVKLGLRTLSQEPQFVGFISTFDERLGEKDVVRELVATGKAAALTAGSSR